MHKLIEAKLTAKGKKFGIVVGRFNNFITDHLVNGAIDALIRSGANDTDITLVKVPGAFEIPLIAKTMAKNRKHNAIICLGAVIRGETSHFDYVCSEVSKGIATVSLGTNIPVIYGILTTDSTSQAIERAGAKSGHKGWDSAISAIEMANLMENLD